MKEQNSHVGTQHKKPEEEVNNNSEAIAGDSGWIKLFNTEKLISASILLTRIGFVLILLLCLMMQGQHLKHFVVLFFLTFGLNVSLIYYKGLLNKSTADDPQKDE